MSRTPRALLDEIASLALLADAASPESLAPLPPLLAELEAERPDLREPIATVLTALEAGEVATVSEAIEALQRAERAPASPPASSRQLVLSDWVEPAMVREFLAAQPAVIEEIEGDALLLERGDGSKLAAIRGRIHTMKGEAGVLGLADLERVCHALEDALESAGGSARVDRLLRVKDWIGTALAAYAAGTLPEPGADAVLAELGAAPAPTPAAPAPAEEQATPAAATSEQASVDRDAETVELIGEFLQESGEGLARADQILMNIERDGLTAEMVNGLFRVFHTIKGVSGFLELRDVTALAHTTETLLNLVRQGSHELKGASLDLVFDATASMRRLLDGVADAVSRRVAFPAAPELATLLADLERAIAGEALPEPVLPAALPGMKLGEILTQPPPALPAETVARALSAQAETGRKLGEELVAQGVVEPKQIAQALRAQQLADGGGAAKIKETIKVDLDRVDSLVEMIGELVIVESMVVNLPEVAAIRSQVSRNYLNQLTKITRDLQGVGMRMRMVPVRGVFQKMARMVRDLSRKSGKQVRMVLSGEGTEMDRSMVEQIADPLVHMIRNSVDHGIEPAEERARAGKSPMGVIHLSAYHEGGSIAIEISDDGGGLNRDRILQKARAQGLVAEGQSLSDAEVNELIFMPGFSTAQQVTEISGRGVGMDVVKRNVEAMRGRVQIASTPGAGTSFKIVLPLTLAIIDGMLVACGEERYIIPTLAIFESIKPDRSMLFSFADRGEMVNVRGETIPLLRLDRLFGIEGAVSDPTQALVMVIESLGRKLGLLVDDVITQQQVVIKSLGSGLSDTRFVSGAAILSDGRVGLILNIEEIGSVFGERGGFRARRELGTAGAIASA
jgi:two-component system chemotaxis sensor kinase CheA